MTSDLPRKDTKDQMVLGVPWVKPERSEMCLDLHVVQIGKLRLSNKGTTDSEHLIITVVQTCVNQRLGSSMLVCNGKRKLEIFRETPSPALLIRLCTT